MAMMGGGEARPEETTGERRKEGNFCLPCFGTINLVQPIRD